MDGVKVALGGGGGCATKRERWVRVESPGAYVTD